MRRQQRNIYDNCGNIYFVTSSIVGHIRLFENLVLCNIFMENLEFYQARGDYKVAAYVLMPNHFHLIIKIDPKTSVSKCIGNLKRITSRKISEYLDNSKDFKTIQHLQHAALRENSNETRIWEYRYDCFVITNEKMLMQKVIYIHNNPIRQGLVANPIDWPYSSAVNYSKSDNANIAVETDWGNMVD